jgi:hypothetical protein
MSQPPLKGINRKGLDASFEADEKRKSELLLTARLLRKQSPREAAEKFAEAAQIEAELSKRCENQGLTEKAFIHRLSAASSWVEAGDSTQATALLKALLRPDLPEPFRQRVLKILDTIPKSEPRALTLTDELNQEQKDIAQGVGDGASQSGQQSFMNQEKKSDAKKGFWSRTSEIAGTSDNIVRITENMHQITKNIHQIILVTAGIVAILAPLAMEAIQWVLSKRFPELAHNVKLIPIYVVISVLASLLIIATGVSLFRKSVWVTEKLNGLGGKAGGLFTKFPDRVKKLIYVFAAISVLYFVGLQTNLWHMTKAMIGGPRIDLASKVQEVTFQPTANLPWLNYGQDFGQVNGWEWKGISKNKEAAEALFKKLSESDIKCVLWFLLFDGRAAPEFDNDGKVTGLDSNFWEDYDAAIGLARKYKVGIVWVLVDFKWMSPKKDEAGASLFGRADVVENDTKRESFFSNALVPIVKRYPYESSIVGWILMNEPDNAVKEGYVSFEAVQQFTARAAGIIKANTHRQPVSVGYADPESMLEYSSKNPGDLDFLIFHHYESFLPPPLSRIRSLMPWAGDKPVYIGEFDKNRPPVPYDEFIAWSRNQGYAGVWPWSFNPMTPEHREDINIIRWERDIQTHRSYCERMKNDEQVNIRTLAEREQEKKNKESELEGDVKNCFQLNEGQLNKSTQKVQVLSSSTIPDLRSQISRAKEPSEITRIKRLLSEAQGNLATEQSNVRLYNQALEGCRRHKNDVEATLRRIESDRKSANNNLAIARRERAHHCSQEFWKSYKVKWARNLYPSGAR